MAFEGFSFYHDPRPGVKLLSRTHGNNTTHNAMKMINSKVTVRKEIMKVTQAYLAENKLNLSKIFTANLLKEHRKLLINNQAVVNLYTRNYLTGFKYVVLNAYYSGKPVTALTDGLKWTYYGLKKLSINQFVIVYCRFCFDNVYLQYINGNLSYHYFI